MDDRFGERVKQAREARKLSRKDVADAIDVTPQAVWNYENRNDGASVDKLFLLADVLAVSARWLATGVEDGVPLRVVDPSLPAIRQSIACLDAFIDGGEKSVDLVHAALRILRGTELTK